MIFIGRCGRRRERAISAPGLPLGLCIHEDILNRVVKTIRGRHQPHGMSAPASNRCALGLGCVTFGREIDRAASFAMLDHAMELGWTHLDTAAAYGNGASERIIGE